MYDESIKFLILSCKCNHHNMFLNQVLLIYLPKKYNLHIFLNTQIFVMVVILVLREFHSLTPATLTVLDFTVVRTYFWLNLPLCLVLYKLDLIVNNDCIPIGKIFHLKHNNQRCISNQISKLQYTTYKIMDWY